MKNNTYNDLPRGTLAQLLCVSHFHNCTAETLIQYAGQDWWRVIAVHVCPVCDRPMHRLYDMLQVSVTWLEPIVNRDGLYYCTDWQTTDWTGFNPYV